MPDTKKSIKLTIPNYDNDLKVLNRIQSLIEDNYPNLFFAVLVHGSIGTNEIISYSDFDGLLILNENYNQKELLDFKKESFKIILAFDPLQHHGWFQILSSDLLKYPQNYLPINTLENAKLIYPIKDSFEITVIKRESNDFKTPLFNMLNQFEKRESLNWRPRNMYQLKSVLSQIMLVPALYYAAKNNDAIFKRESFEMVRPYFSNSEWMPIAVATEIRAQWYYKMNIFQKWILASPNKLIRMIAARFFAPKIPLDIQEKITLQFYKNLMLLTSKIKEEIS